jgi:hypothetical protein
MKPLMDEFCSPKPHSIGNRRLGAPLFASLLYKKHEKKSG